MADTIEAIVFDVDGVLVHAGEFGRLLERNGIGPENAAEFFRGPFRDCVLGNADVAESIAPFVERWGWPESTDEALRLWFEADSRVDHDTLAVVDALRDAGYRCFVASTQEARRAAYLQDVIGLGAHFEELFFSCRVGLTKGNPEFFRRVSDRLGVAPSATLFFDDAEGIVESARTAGWNAEVYTFGADIRALLRSYGVPDTAR